MMTVTLIAQSVPTVPSIPTFPNIARVIAKRIEKGVIAPNTCKTSIAVIRIHKRVSKATISKTEGVVVEVAIPKR
jgi:hypothetical protein